MTTEKHGCRKRSMKGWGDPLCPPKRPTTRPSSVCPGLLWRGGLAMRSLSRGARQSQSRLAEASQGTAPISCPSLRAAREGSGAGQLSDGREEYAIHEFTVSPNDKAAAVPASACAPESGGTTDLRFYHLACSGEA
jgi:hypothetical protein